MGFGGDFNSYKSFDRGHNAFISFIFLLIIAVACFNGYQYVNRPDCNDGVLIQDDAGVFRCVSKDTPIFIRGTHVPSYGRYHR